MVGGGGVNLASSSGLPPPEHVPKLGWFVYVLAATAAISGFLFGYDTGIISAAMLFIVDDDAIGVHSSGWHEVIVASTAGFAAIGALSAAPLADRFGRKRVIVWTTFLFIAGGLVCGCAVDKFMLLAGRILLGITLGFVSMIVPVYIGECAPVPIRGKLVIAFQLLLTIGVMASNIIAAGFALINPVYVGWRLMLGFAIVPAALQLAGMVVLPESPRWLYAKGTAEEAREVVSRIYNGDEAWIEFELEEIRFAKESHDKAANSDDRNIFVRIWTTPHVRKALFIGAGAHTLMQTSGINAVMYYVGTLVKASGIQSNETTIWISAGIAGIHFVFTIIPMFTVERFGRRPILIISTAATAIALGLIAGSFYLIDVSSASVSSTWAPANGVLTNTSNELKEHEQSEHGKLNCSKSVSRASAENCRIEQLWYCSKFRNCDSCVTNDACGFCGPSGATWGYCLPLSSSTPSSISAEGVCAMSHASYNGTSYEWSDVACKTQWVALPIVLLALFLVVYSAGLGPVPWVLNAEFYPTWARGTCASIAMASNLVTNLLVTLTVLTLFNTITKAGTFALYGIITAVAAALFYFVVPETGGKPLDEVEQLFMSKKQRQQHAINLSWPDHYPSMNEAKTSDAHE